MKQTICILLAVSFFYFTNGAHSKTPEQATLSGMIKLAEEGDADVQYMLGYSTLFEEEVLGEKLSDLPRAKKWLDASIKTNPFYGWFIGSQFARKNSPILAQIYLQKAVNAGYTEAFSSLAHLYLGHEHSKAGNLLAKRYFEASASYGNFYSLVRIGHIYQNGWGVEQNFKEAKSYFKEAINHGETSGYTALGEMKEKHLPNPDFKEILSLYLRDALNGGSTAIMGIKRLYRKHNEHIGLTETNVLYWHYVDKYKGIHKLGMPISILEDETGLDDDLSNDQILKIKKKAEALVKSFSKL